MANAIAECLGGQKELPTILYSRLYDEGFICIDRGFLRKDMLAFTGQVGDISGNAIFLEVEQDELVKV